MNRVDECILNASRGRHTCLMYHTALATGWKEQCLASERDMSAKFSFRKTEPVRLLLVIVL